MTRRNRTLHDKILLGRFRLRWATIGGAVMAAICIGVLPDLMRDMPFVRPWMGGAVVIMNGVYGFFGGYLLALTRPAGKVIERERVRDMR